jgi:CRP-like cAMP-binding protein
VFVVQTRKVKLTVVSPHGKESVVAILPEGSFFGEGCLAGQPFRMSTTSAVERNIILRMTKQTMVALLHRDPQFAERFLAYLLSRNVHMEADLVGPVSQALPDFSSQRTPVYFSGSTFLLSLSEARESRILTIEVSGLSRFDHLSETKK